MRLCIGLTALLLTAPVVHASPTEPTLIHLYGHQTEHVVLEWDVYGEDLLSLELVRILDGAVEVVPLNPETRTYADVGASAAMNITYILYGEFDTGVTSSNAYESSCEFAGVTSGVPPVFVEPRCINDIPVVSEDVQAWVKQAMAEVLAGN